MTMGKTISRVLQSTSIPLQKFPYIILPSSQAAATLRAELSSYLLSINHFLPCKISIMSCSLFLKVILVSCFVVIFLHAPSFTQAATTLSGNETDHLALLAIKAQITLDPLGLMSSWNDSLHFCNWGGIVCGNLHQRVITLNLSHYGLVGSLSPQIGNMSFLRGISLEQNYFHGEIPQEIGRLDRLKYINFSNNSFSGEIPANLSGCSSLLMLRLGFNKLTGQIPYQLGSLQKLERVQLHYNNLNGSVPDSLGNISSVRSLSLSVNNFEGSIPDALGRLKTLNFLGLGLNKLSGMIPPTIFNLSSLIVFTLPYNQLHGTLPSDLGLTLPNLQVLNIGHNFFSGPLPVSISNASNLLELDIDASNFTKVTIDFGGVPNLWSLALSSNPLGKGEADDLSFIDSLTKCRNLRLLDLSNSHFGGVIPDSIGNLSTQLFLLKLGGNQLSGSIPIVIENLLNLAELTMEKNYLSGSIPSVLGNLKMLQRLDLSENKLSGLIPSSLGNITRLFEFHLQKNQIMGSIPSSFGNLKYLQNLDLSQNLLSGTIPKEVMGLSSLTISLNLAQNQLTGPLPPEAQNLMNLGFLDVSENKLYGQIPSSLGSCVTLEKLHMQGNFFEGAIPPSFSSLRGIRDMDLSRNNLSGQIPQFLKRFALISLNLSFNHFEGEVPREGAFLNATAISLSGNKRLCGGIPQLKLPRCVANRSKNGKTSLGVKLMIALLTPLLVLGFVMSILVINRLRMTNRQSSLASSLSSKQELLLKVSYRNLHKATGGFSSANLIGAGSFGSVYRGILDPNETVVAVKVLFMRQRKTLKSFVAECEILKNIRHRNLVKILTACSSVDFQGNDFKALVYEFMPNGTLESWLHPFPRTNGIDEDLKILSFHQRLNIAIDVAAALNYLHYQCHKPIVHCDLKPSNVLLDNDMTAHVGDFGLARFVEEAINPSHRNESSSVGLKGTVGYAAPEYGMGSKPSMNGDVYSYGILLLEMFTGKRPTDDMFNDGLDLHNFVKTALPDQISEVVNPLFVTGGEGDEEETGHLETRTRGQIKKDQMQESLITILRIGIACSVESINERKNVKDVLTELQNVSRIFLGSGRN